MAYSNIEKIHGHTHHTGYGGGKIWRIYNKGKSGWFAYSVGVYGMLKGATLGDISKQLSDLRGSNPMATKKHKPRRSAPKKKTASRRRPIGTSQTLKSMITGKTPSKRLKKRGAKNTDPGYYPNPLKVSIVPWPTANGYAVMKGGVIIKVFSTKAEAVRYARVLK